MTNAESRATPTYHGLEALRRTHPAWRLLRADHAPLVIGFLNATFIASNRRTIAQAELASRLEDYLYLLREKGLGDDAFHKRRPPNSTIGRPTIARSCANTIRLRVTNPTSTSRRPFASAAPPPEPKERIR